MRYKQIIYSNTPIQSQPKEKVISEMQRYYKYKMKDNHIVAYFYYDPGNLNNLFPLCVMETFESIFTRFRDYKPKESWKCDVLEDMESIIFPKYSIVDCAQCQF